jgi:hypothetical protein
VGLTVPSYFYDRWDRNFHGQTTIWRCGVSVIHPLEPAGVLGGARHEPHALLMQAQEIQNLARDCTLNVAAPFMVVLDGDTTILLPPPPHDGG